MDPSSEQRKSPGRAWVVGSQGRWFPGSLVPGVVGSWGCWFLGSSFQAPLVPESQGSPRRPVKESGR